MTSAGPGAAVPVTGGQQQSPPHPQAAAGTSWGQSCSIRWPQHPAHGRQPRPHPRCCSPAPEQRPWGGGSPHGDPCWLPPSTAALTTLERHQPSLQIKAIAFLANIDSSSFSVNIYSHLNKTLLLQPHGRSQRLCGRSRPAFQHRTRFHCSWLQRGQRPRRGAALGSPAPHTNTSHAASFGRGRGIPFVCRRGKAFGLKSPALQPWAPVTAQEQDVATSPVLGLSQRPFKQGPNRCHSNK